MIALRQMIERFDVRPQNSKLGAIGVDFAIEKMHLVQMEKIVSGDVIFRARTSIRYPETREELLNSPRELKQLLHRALHSGPFNGRKIVTTMPAHDVRIMPLAYQVSRGQNDAEAILKLIAKRVPRNIEDYVIDYLPVRSSEQDEERLAIVAVANRDRVIAYLESLRKAGFIVDTLDIGPSAIKRLISAISGDDSNESRLVVNFGSSKSFMTLISGRRLLFDQEFEFGEQALLERISVSLDVSLETARDLVYKHGLVSSQETDKQDSLVTDTDISSTLAEIVKPKFAKLIDEINRALIYAASETRGGSVKQVYLLGSIARWKGIDKLLHTLVNLPVTIPSYSSISGEAGGSDDYVGDQEILDTAVAIGLALRGLTAHE